MVGPGDLGLGIRISEGLIMEGCVVAGITEVPFNLFFCSGSCV